MRTPPPLMRMAISWPVRGSVITESLPCRAATPQRPVARHAQEDEDALADQELGEALEPRVDAADPAARLAKRHAGRQRGSGQHFVHASVTSVKI